MSEFKEIFDLIRHERVVLVIGAGFSRNAGMPSCSELCDAIRASLPDDIKSSKKDMDEFSGNNLQQLSDDFINIWGEEGREKLIDSIKALFNIKNDADLSVHIALSRIPHFSKIHTTNYDTLLEYVYKEDSYVIKLDKDFKDVPKDKILIFKTHGDFENPDSLVISRSDYDAFFKGRRHEMLWQELKRDATSKTILFMGYSLSDSNFQDLLKEIKKNLNGNTHQHYLVAPGWTASKIRMLERYHIKYYNGTGEEFFKELTEYLKKHIIRDCARKITSPETCERFNLFHNNATEIIIKPNENNIIHVKPLNGANEQAKLTLSADKMLLINEGRMPEFEISPITGSLLPSLTLNANEGDFQNCSITLNGIEITTSEITKVLIQPAITRGSCQIKIPSLHFNEKFKYISYSLRNQCLVHDIDTELYTLKIEIKPNQNTNMCTHTFSFEFKEEFSSLSRARTLMQLPGAIQSGLAVLIKGLTMPSTIDLPTREPDNPCNWSNAPIQCYLNLLEIIEDYGGKFDRYPHYSLENLRCALLLASYLKKVSIPFLNHSSLNIKFSIIDSQSENKMDMIVGRNYGFYEFFENIRIEFAGTQWHIPQLIRWYSDCTVIENRINQEGKRFVKLCDNGGPGGLCLTDNGKQKLLPNKRQRNTVALLQEAMRYIGKFPFP